MKLYLSRGMVATAFLAATLSLLLASTRLSAASPNDGAALGVIVQNIPFARLDQMGIPQGVSVRSVLPGSSAHDAGIEPNDILVAMDEMPIYSTDRLLWLVSKQPPGRSVSLSLRRSDGGQWQPMDVAVTLAEAPPLPERATLPSPGEPAWLGIQMQPLTGPLRRGYGIPEYEGVMIAAIESDSPAERAGLEAGDVLLRVDRRRVRSPRDVNRAIDFFDPGDRVELEVIRDATRRTIEITLGGKAVASRTSPGAAPAG